MRLLAPVVVGAMRTFQHMTVEGGERIAEREPLIVVANHTCHLDGPELAGVLYEAGVVPHTAARADLFSIPVLGWALRQLGQVPVYRPGVASTPKQGNAASTMAAMSEVLTAGGTVLIFPESTFTRDPAEWPMRGKTGAVRLALEHPEATVVPLAHWGNENLINKWGGKVNWRAIARRDTPVAIRWGQPVDLSAFRGRPVTHELLTEATSVVMDAITEELMHLRSGVPTQPRWDRAIDGDPFKEIDARNQARAKNRGARIRGFGCAGVASVVLAKYFMGRRRK